MANLALKLCFGFLGLSLNKYFSFYEILFYMISSIILTSILSLVGISFFKKSQKGIKEMNDPDFNIGRFSSIKSKINVYKIDRIFSLLCALGIFIYIFF